MQENQSASDSSQLTPGRHGLRTRIGGDSPPASSESSGSGKHRNEGRAPRIEAMQAIALTVNVVDAYVEVLPEDGQVDVALARARAVRHEQAGGTARVRTGCAAAEHRAGLRAGS